jgi:hypothetical protein
LIVDSTGLSADAVNEQRGDIAKEETKILPNFDVTRDRKANEDIRASTLRCPP